MKQLPVHRRLRRLALVSSLALVVGWAASGSAFAQRPASSWRGVTPLPPKAVPAMLSAAGFLAPSVSSNDELFADTCSTPAQCWAVGFQSNGAGAELGQAILFNGTTSSSVSVPEPAGTSGPDFDYLDGTACASSSDCWVVGSYGNKAGGSLNETLQWNGATWSLVASPEPGGTTGQSEYNELNDVTCVSASDCWAVGDYTNQNGAYLNEALHWDGTQWTVVPTPNPDGTTASDDNVLYSVSCTSMTACLSVGYGHNSAGAYVSEALEWNGVSWSSVPPLQPGGTGSRNYGYLEGVACVSASECLAAGGYLDSAGAYDNEILLWNGTSWTRESVPEPDSRASLGVNELTAVSCLPASGCWAVGYYDNRYDGELNEALRWSGHSWSFVPTPQPAGSGNNSVGNVLYGVSCGSSSYCLAVGYTFKTGGPSRKQELLWNGTSWSVG